jgi:TldD protein
MRTRAAAALVGLLVAVAAVAPLFSEPVADSAPMRALQAELARSLGGLQMPNEPSPYYIAYSLYDVVESGCRATLGALVESRTTRGRVVRADVRVGDYTFDSSRFVGGTMGSALTTMGLVPTDDDELAMRRQIWLTTDTAYKNSVQAFSRKKAAAQNRNDNDPIPDFAKESPVDYGEPVAAPAPMPSSWEQTATEISSLFKLPAVVSSEVSLSASDMGRYFVNSEGFRTVVPVRSVGYRAFATVLADDGMELRDAVTVTERLPEDLPSKAELAARTKQMLDGLLVLRTAKIGEDYSGPVLVEGEAAAALVARAFVPYFSARRPPDSDDMRMGGSQSVSPYQTRIGNRVLPESFSVKDTPSMKRFGARPVGGAYVVDDEGLKAEDVTLVQDGRLKTLLTTRTPVKNLPKTNGHARGGGPQAGVFQVESSAPMTSAALKDKLIEMLKLQGRPYGYIVRRLVPGTRSTQIAQAVKVTVDGKEEPVRGVALGSITHTTFRDIVAGSDARTLYTYAASAGMVGNVLVSVIVPDLLFEELDIQKDKSPQPKKPIVPSPIGERQ